MVRRGAANPEIAWMGLDGVDYAASGSAAARNGQGQRLRWCGDGAALLTRQRQGWSYSAIDSPAALWMRTKVAAVIGHDSAPG
jgi:hypothetical protein